MERVDLNTLERVEVNAFHLVAARRTGVSDHGYGFAGNGLRGRIFAPVFPAGFGAGFFPARMRAPPYGRRRRLALYWGMITAVLSVFAAVWVLGVITFVVAARRAPVGFEDAEGFHAAEQTQPPKAVIGATVRVH